MDYPCHMGLGPVGKKTGRCGKKSRMQIADYFNIKGKRGPLYLCDACFKEWMELHPFGPIPTRI